MKVYLTSNQCLTIYPKNKTDRQLLPELLKEHGFLISGTEDEIMLPLFPGSVPDLLRDIPKEWDLLSSCLKILHNGPDKPSHILKIGKKTFNFLTKRYIMGILNMTPDSFYASSRSLDKEKLEQKIKTFKNENVHLIDIGGQSTRPGSTGVTEKEELNRIIPAYKACRKLAPGIPISIDTYRSSVAEKLLKLGAEMINDISGLTFDKNMSKVIARHKAAVVLMHTSGKPASMQKKTEYSNLMGEITDYFRRAVKKAREEGIQKILLDPGIGFGKTVEQNYAILDRLNELKILDRPLLIGLSRKSLIGKILRQEPEDRLSATMALNLAACLKGCSIIRVHDVKIGQQTIRLADQLFKSRRSVH